MKNRRIITLLTTLVVFIVIGLTSCNNDEPIPTEKAFIGSEKCSECHADHYDRFVESGHPYKLNKVVDGKQPVIPFTTADGLNIPLPAQANGSWNNVTYMIGGFGWKARFLDSKGYIMTQDSDTQYNLENGSQVAYHGSNAPGTLPYDCGKCHTTGWKSINDGGVKQDGLEGIHGEFFAGGIHCEQCHGMGNIHAVTEKKEDITLDKSDELCGQCHTRNADRSIAAGGGFIQHHEQYDELLTSGKHRSMGVTCNTCHDPHSSVKYDAKAKGEGVKKSCTECHSTYKSDNHLGNLSCETCHMPMVTKTALKTGDFKGDIRTHIFKINTSATDKFFSEDGKLANVNGKGVTLDYACYQCHNNAEGKGGGKSAKTMEQLSVKAINFHGTK